MSTHRPVLRDQQALLTIGRKIHVAFRKRRLKGAGDGLLAGALHVKRGQALPLHRHHARIVDAGLQHRAQSPGARLADRDGVPMARTRGPRRRAPGSADRRGPCIARPVRPRAKDGRFRRLRRSPYASNRRRARAASGCRVREAKEAGIGTKPDPPWAAASFEVERQQRRVPRKPRQHLGWSDIRGYRDRHRNLGALARAASER